MASDAQCLSTRGPVRCDRPAGHSPGCEALGRNGRLTRWTDPNANDHHRRTWWAHMMSAPVTRRDLRRMGY